MYTKEKRAYVEKLRETMAPIQDFGGIRYVNDPRTGAEYIKVWDVVGGAQFLNVTGYSLEDVLKDVATLVLGRVPDSVVISIDEKRLAARLFRIQEGL